MVTAPQTYQAAGMPVRREPQYELEPAMVNGRVWDGKNELAGDVKCALSTIYRRAGKHVRRPCER